MEKTATSSNLRVIASASFLAGLSYSVMQAVWQPFVLSLGAPMSTVGLLESLGGFRGVATALIQPVGGWLSDCLGRKTPHHLGQPGRPDGRLPLHTGGLLYDRFGFQAPILANLVGVVVALVIILFTVKEPSLAERDR